MTLLLEASVPRTLHHLPHLLAGAAAGGAVEAWLFEDEAPRRRMEATLAEKGIRARLRSAYKPLVHAFLEDFPREGLARVSIAYPVEEAADPLRFRLEAYPLAALLGGAALAFVPGAPGLTYAVELAYDDGQVVRERVFAPNRLRPDAVGAPALSPCGWLRIAGVEGPAVDRAIETEAETLFAAVMGAIAAHPWGEEPLFDQLAIWARLPGIERDLPEAGEAISLAEALHEDLYFSAHAALACRPGRPAGARFRPGQIVPEVVGSAGDEAVIRMECRPYRRPRTETAGRDGPLGEAPAAPSLAGVEAELAALGGEAIEAVSVQGRRVAGRLLDGPSPAVLVTAGQHGNETSGVVGALRAAGRLKGKVRLGLIPVENPDGYALHRHLCRRQPHHIHHAARFTALGDDVEARAGEPLWEAAARREALRRTGAELHVNLHGYPAHEWTQPFTGYLPRGFEAWTMPRGFFLILRHHPGWGGRAEAFLEAVTARLAEMPGLDAFNAGQIARAAAHGGALPAPLRHGIPCLVAESLRAPNPITLVTEFPDETITGERFRFAHEVQMRAVLAAVDAWQALGPLA